MFIQVILQFQASDDLAVELMLACDVQDISLFKLVVLEDAGEWLAPRRETCTRALSGYAAGIL